MIKKNLWKWMSYTLLLAMMSSLLIFSACSEDDEKPEEPFEGSIMALISSDKYKVAEGADPSEALDSLVKYLNTYPDLVALLSSTTEYTLFAPSNEAFINLLATPDFPEDIRDINPAVIKAALSYHIVAGLHSKDAVCDFGTTGHATLYQSTDPCTGGVTDQVIKTDANCKLVTGSSNPAIEFEDADNETTNGVVHVVRTVLIPPSIGASLTPILGKLSAVILLGADFTHLAKAVTKADCATAAVDDIATILSGAGPYTAFLPPNPVFEGTAVALLGAGATVDQLIANFTAAQWRAILLNHIVSGTNNNAALTNALVLTTILNANAKLTVETVTPGAPPAGSPVGKLLDTSSTTPVGFGGTLNAPIYVVDVPASNGVAHVVGKILFPN